MGTPTKVCIVCGTDVSQRKRTKDQHGNYYCQPCWTKRAQSQAKPEYACHICHGLFAVHEVHDDNGTFLCTPCFQRQSKQHLPPQELPSATPTLTEPTEEPNGLRCAVCGGIFPVTDIVDHEGTPACLDCCFTLESAKRKASDAAEELLEFDIAPTPITVRELLRSHPLLGTAAILSFLWAGIMVLVSMYQIGNKAEGWGAWNTLVSTGYILIGLGLLHRKSGAFNWGIGSNILNSVLGLYQIITQGIPILGLLLIVQVLIVVFLVMERKAFPKRQQTNADSSRDNPPRSAAQPPRPPASAMSRFLRGGLLGLLDERFCVSRESMKVTGKTTGQKLARLGILAGITVVGFIGLVLGMGFVADLSSKVGKSGSLSSASDDPATSSITFAEFDGKFGASALTRTGSVPRTDAQIAADLKPYLGRPVRWIGTVLQAQAEGQVALKVTASTMDQVWSRNHDDAARRLVASELGTMGQDEVQVILRLRSPSEAARISFNQRITFSGRLTGIGNPYPYVVEDGSLE